MKRTMNGLASLAVIFILGTSSGGAASAHVFLWTGPLPSLLLVLSTKPQIFTFGSGAELLNITCQHFRGDAKSLKPVMSAKSIVAVGTYSSCEKSGTPVTVTPAEYELNADGTLAVTGKPIVFTLEGTAKCSLKVSNGGGNSHLLRLTIGDSSGGTQVIHLIVGNIHSVPSGGVCGAAGVETTQSLYLGLLRLSVEGGTIRWA